MLRPIKRISIFVLVILLLAGMFSIAGADGGTWICPNCHEQRTTEYCPICAAKRPASSGDWVCSTCGQTWPAAYNFCPDDQTPKSSGSWPVRVFSGVGITLKTLPNNRNIKRMSYLGPGSNIYAAGGEFKASSVQNAIALFREGDYALVDFYYPSIGKCCLYFSVRDLTSRDIETITLTPHPAHVISDVQPVEGPGYDYRALELLTPRKFVKEVILTPGTQINVFFEMNGWVFIEFTGSIGRARAWLPAGQVESN